FAPILISFSRSVVSVQLLIDLGSTNCRRQFALAYNLANFLRQLVLPKSIKSWTLTTLREKLIKIGAKVVRHSKYVLFQLAEVAVPRKLFARILGRIARLCPASASG